MAKKGLITGSPETGTAGGGDVFRKVFENIQTGILIIDPEAHVIVDANPLAEFLTGRTRDELIGSPCHGFVCPAKCGECPITDLHIELYNVEQMLINAKGEKVPILKTVAKADIGGREYLIESFIDIIDRKKSEERKLAFIAFLSESVLRTKKPLEIMQRDFQQMADRAKTGTTMRKIYGCSSRSMRRTCSRFY
jgi:PAS domain S-box-containing protein